MNKLVLAAAVVAAGFSGSSVFAEGKSIGVGKFPRGALEN